MFTRTLLACFLSALPVHSQSSTQPPRPIGVVTAIDAAARRITLKTDAGPEMPVEFQDTTRFLRVAPGSQDLSTAARITLSGLASGDRILVRGRTGGESGLFLADTIIVMSKTDLAKKQEAERADWERRGIGGVITTLDLAAREAAIRVGGVKSSQSVVLELPAGVKLRRYSPDSVRFSDARDSRPEELRIGDQVKARGTISQDGTRFRVEELVSGSFRNFAATVVAVGPEQGTLQVMDQASKSRIDARVLPASTLRRLTAPVIEKIGSSIGASDGRALQALIEALPAMTLAELKPGDALVISGITTADPTRLTAITILAGVEPLLKPTSRGARPPDIGSWSLDLNMGVGLP